ncbi:uncharacterized protein LOC143474594 [Brachyhypopomus gauderio]|uniref:uncharacterized protein LOC143474594 n=1 Tax=Brachyhypopomus gauderio TaxID=698409 RepID=UPI004042AA72
MAEGGSYVDADKFKCPICLDLMRMPVTIPCGHSYCMTCIRTCWSKGEEGARACPQCRRAFDRAPELAQNSLLADVVEKLRAERTRASSVACGSSAGPRDVLCDVCMGGEVRAVKSCLVCLASYCGAHVRAHYECPVFQKHKLVPALARLQDKVCPRHNKLLEFYCQTDKRCVCYVCMFSEHRGHNVVSAEAERATKKMQKQLAAVQQSSQQRIKNKEKELKELKQTVVNFKHPVKAALSESCVVRDSLIKAVKHWQTELERLIRDEERSAGQAADAVLAQQGEQLAQLHKTHADLVRLSQSDDHIGFLQSFEALCGAGPGSGQEDPASRIDCGGSAAKAVMEVHKRLETFCHVELSAFSKRAKDIEELLFKPKTRADFLRYACPLTLDPNTVNCWLELNMERRAVTRESSFCSFSDAPKVGPAPRPYAPHPRRFDYQGQVLCREPLFGRRFYWEVEGECLRGTVAVCYGRIPRKENSYLDDLTNSSMAWSAECLGPFQPCYVRHAAQVIEKFVDTGFAYELGKDGKKLPTKLAVFLDHPAGLLSFYLVSRQESLVHMYTFRTTFTEPLYVGLKPVPGCTLSLCSLDPPTPSGPLQYVATSLDYSETAVSGSVRKSRDEMCLATLVSTLEKPREKVKPGASSFAGPSPTPRPHQEKHPHQETTSRQCQQHTSVETKLTRYVSAPPVSPMSSSTAASSDHRPTVCVVRKRGAERSCAECVDSHCETHLDLHTQKKLRSVGTAERRETICTDHDKPLMIYCRTDQRCICQLCLADKHKGHEVSAVKKEVLEKKIKLVTMHKKIVERIQIWKEKVEEVEGAIALFKTSTEEVLEKSERFSELIHAMEERKRVVEELIREKEEAVVKQAEDLLERARQEIQDLMRGAVELENLEALSYMDDGVHFLNSSVSQLTKDFQTPALVVHPYSSFQLVSDAVSDLVWTLDITCQWKLITISDRVKSVGIVSSPLPTTSEEFLRYASKLTIDPNTVHDLLCLSKGAELMAMRERQNHPVHAQRFERRQQALCTQPLRGAPCYWEVECGRGGSWVSIAVSYEGIACSGRKAALFGRCPRSWALRKHGPCSYEFWHNDKASSIASSIQCYRVGVYLDHGAGVLAFYNVTDNMSLIHKVQTTFTEPVYAGFGLVGIGSNVKLCF